MRTTRWTWCLVAVLLLLSIQGMPLQELQKDETRDKTLAEKPGRFGVFISPLCRFADPSDVFGLFTQPYCPDHVKGDCQNVMKSGEIHEPSGTYALKPDSNPPLFAVCDMEQEEGGWTVIQQRKSGLVDFNKGWYDYKNGFGPILEDSDYWIGLQKLRRLMDAVNTPYRLRVEMVSITGSVRYAEYDSFGIGDEDHNYRLSIGNYNGTAGDALRPYNGRDFTTKDWPQHAWSRYCNVPCLSGWWFHDCYHANTNLNGVYTQHLGVTRDAWNTWPGPNTYFKQIRMMIRRNVQPAM